MNKINGQKEQNVQNSKVFVTMKHEVLKFFPIFLVISYLSYRESRFPQRAIDVGLFISGEINYEPDSLMYEIYVNSFTILHYFSAFLLQNNFAIVEINFIFQFINLSILAISVLMISKFLRINLFLNYLLIFLILFNIPSLLLNLTFNYPLYIYSVNTYGQYGLSLSLLLIALLLNQRYSIVVFLLPIFFSIHSGWALTASIVGFFYLLINREVKKLLTKKNLLIFLTGIVLVFPFWLDFLIKKSKFIKVSETQLIEDLYQIYISNWDYHRSFGLEQNKFIIHLIVLFFVSLMLIFIFKLKSFMLLSNFLKILLITLSLALFLTYLDLRIFNKKFMTLNSFMPGKIINLVLILYLIMIFYIIKIIFDKILRILDLTKYESFIFFAAFIVTFLAVYVDDPMKFNIGKKREIYNVNQENSLCDYLQTSKSKIVTISTGSQLSTIVCNMPILIDSTQIDFIPYSLNSIYKLKNILDYVYGFDFESRAKTSDFVGTPSIPSGGIDDFLVKPIWSSRNIDTWQFLACRFDFDTVVVPADFELNIMPELVGDKFNAYKIASNCKTQSKKFIGDKVFSLPREFDPKLGEFFWLTEKTSVLKLRHFNLSRKLLKIHFLSQPNPCKNNYSLRIFDDFNSKIFEVGADKKLIEFSHSPNNKKYSFINFEVISKPLNCYIKNEDRILVSQISQIDLKY